MELEYASRTTLSNIRAASPCEEGWTKLLKHLGKTKADDEPLDLLTVLNSNGLADALWVLKYAAPECERLARHCQAEIAEQVLPIFEIVYPNDSRIRDQIAMLRNDDASDEDRAAARASARDAARAAWVAGDTQARAASAAWAARAAAWDARAAQAAAWAAGSARDAQERQLRKMLTAKKRNES